MFVEFTAEVYEKMKPVLFEMGVDFESSDCTLPGEEMRHVHLEFGEMSQELAKKLADEIDKATAEAAEESKEQER